MQCARPVEILPELDGRCQLPGELDVACEIVISNRFLEPVEALPVERVTAVQGIAKTEALIEVDHQLDVRAGRVAHRLYRGEIVSQSVAAQAQLEALEAAFGDKRSSVVGQTGYLGKPQAIAVVGRHRTGRAAQQDGERHAGRLRQGVPCRHIEPGYSDHRHAFIADQVKRSAAVLKILDRPDGVALALLGKIVDRRHDVARRMLQIRFEIAATDNPFLGCELNKNHRPLIEQTNLGYDRPAKRDQDRPGPHGPESEFLEIHRILPRHSGDLAKYPDGIFTREPASRHWRSAPARRIPCGTPRRARRRPRGFARETDWRSTAATGCRRRPCRWTIPAPG